MQLALILTLVLTAHPTNSPATAQAPDILLYENKVHDLFSNPLEALYEKAQERPRFMVSPGTMSTGLWRGYIAIWEIADDTLYLKGIDSWVCEADEAVPEKCERADLKKLFGEKLRDRKVLANWFSGELRIPDGKQLQYVHMGYGSVYERDIFLTVQAGKITDKRIVDNTKTKLPSRLELQRQELEKLKPTEKAKP